MTYATPAYRSSGLPRAVFVVYIPNAEEYRQALREQVYELLKPSRWAQFDPSHITPEEAAEDLTQMLGGIGFFYEVLGTWTKGDIDPPCFT